MIEVFIPYSKTSNIEQLGWTLEAWDTDEYEPVALEVKSPANEQLNHVAAEAIAKGEYIIAALGTEPDNPEGWKRYKKGQGIMVEACQPRVQ